MDANLVDLIGNWHLFKDDIVLFLGAGASFGAKTSNGLDLPNGFELRNRIWRDLKHSDPAEAFDPAELKLMNLEHAAAIVESKTGRPALSNYLKSQFDCNKPTWQHIVMTYLKPKAVLTTNYDELIELGFKHNPQKVDIICDDRRPASDNTPIYKPHGSLSHSDQPIGAGGLVITQFDYFEFIDKYRSILRRSMTGFDAACVITIGYSFSDMDIGAEFYSIRHKMAGTPWYAVFPRSDIHVRRMYSKKLNIEQIDTGFEDFLRILDEHVDFIPDRFKHHRIPQLVEEGVIQATSPPLTS
ncbi:MAG: cold-shock protein [Caulobacter sp.]|nr:cold-shock protein [Caulobacter sp.]